MALKLRRGGRSGQASRGRSYPTLDELQAFGREVAAFTILLLWSPARRKVCATH